MRFGGGRAKRRKRWVRRGRLLQKKKKKKKIYEDWLFLVGKKVKGTSSLVILCNLKRRQLLQFSFVHF